MTQRVQYSDFLASVEASFQRAIRRCHLQADSWDENHITLSLLEELREDHPAIDIVGFNRPFHIRWDAFKLTGIPEQTFGDIAVLIRFTTWQREVLEGVGFLEAKKRHLVANTFPALGTAQLRALRARTCNLFLLLYDHSEVLQFDDNLRALQIGDSDIRYWDHYGEVRSFTSHAVVVPADIALNLPHKTDALYKFSLPLSFQLCGRFLRGFDLDFRPSAVKTAKGHSTRFGQPRTLLSVTVSTTADAADEIENPNPDFYDPIRPERKG